MFFGNEKDTLEIVKINKNVWEIRFWYSINERLLNSGFEDFFKIIRDEDDNICTVSGDNLYIIKEVVSSKDLDMGNAEVVKEAIRLVAKFHKALRGFKPMPGSKIKLDWGKWQGNLKTYLSRLNAYMISKEYNSDLDFSNVVEGIKEAIDILEESDYEKLIEYAMNEKQIILNEKISKVLGRADDGKIYVKSLERCIYDLKAKDLANIIKEHIYESIEKVNVSELVECYKEHNTFGKEEEMMLSVYLFTPDKLMNQFKRCMVKKSNDDEMNRSLKKSLDNYNKLYNMLREK